MINILFDEIFHFTFYEKIIRLKIELYKRIRYIYIYKTILFINLLFMLI